MFRHGRNSFVRNIKLNEVKVIFEAVQSIKLRSYCDSLCENAESLVDEETSVNC